ncbi:MAG: hypothetical protein ACRDKL_08780 [Solirubrobacteraceae bacterium]
MPPSPRTPDGPVALIRWATAAERPQIRALLDEPWGSKLVISCGVAHYVSILPAPLAPAQHGIRGLATLRFDGDVCELVTLNAHGELERELELRPASAAQSA